MNWYYVENGQQKGPVAQDQLDELARQGTIKADTLVWTDGMANWLPYSQARPGTGAAPMPPSGGTAYAASVPVADAEAMAKQKIAAPAVGLIVSGAFGILGGIMGLLTPLWVGAFIRFLEQSQPGNPGIDQMKAMMSVSSVTNIIFGTLNIAVAGFTIYAAIRMKNLRGHGLAVAASILSMLPYLSGCCCVGLPLGIWALVVLFNGQVKSSFR